MNILLLLVSQAFAFHVMIDPGHGGNDVGAVQGSQREADLVLKVGKKLHELIIQDGQWDVSLTRRQDETVSLQQRVRTAEKSGADLFVSLHANSAPVKTVKGVEIFFENTKAADEDALYLAHLENQSAPVAEKDSPTPENKQGDLSAILSDLRRQKRQQRSLRLGRLIKKEIRNDEPETSVSIKQAPLYVVSRTAMPAVLVEIGFMTNPQELKALTNEERQGVIAGRIYESLKAYEKSVRKLEKPLEPLKAAAPAPSAGA